MKQIIWSSETFYDDTARAVYQDSQRDFLEDEEYYVADPEWSEVVQGFLDDERNNLNCDVDGIIIAFADLGLWHGRRQGFKIYDTNIATILKSSEDENEWYGDGKDIRSRHIHHDGTNYVLYRIVPDMEAAELVGEMIYNREINEDEFIKCTESLYPYVAEIYDWPL